MISSREDFDAIVRKWWIFMERDSTEGESEEEQIEILWDAMGLQAYVERMYMLCKDDVRKVAKIELRIDLDSMELPDTFWHDVEKGIESGLGSDWMVVVKAAIRCALDV